ncbi:MAG: hypothetical protein ACREVG_08840 [Burkholderiales bacterium]
MRFLLAALLIVARPVLADLEYPPRAYAPVPSIAAAIAAGRLGVPTVGKRAATDAVYTGGVRALQPQTGEALRAWIATVPGWHAPRRFRYVREFEFESGGTRHWLAVAEGGDFARHMAPREAVRLAIDLARVPDGSVLAAVRAIGRAGDRQFTRTVNDVAREEVQGVADAARTSLARVLECAALYARSHTAIGVPPSLAALGPSGSGCLDAQLASGRLDRYRLYYWPGVRDPAGNARIHFACARPERDVLDGVETHAGDERGMATRDYADFDDGVSRTCTQAAQWQYDALRHLKACLVVHADRDGGSGYAANLLSFGAAGNGCLAATPEASAKLHDTLFETNDGLLYYEPDANVPRTRFQVRHKRRSNRHEIEYLATETGSRHGALSDGRGATRADPEPEVFVARLAASDQADRERQAAWRTTCEAGNAHHCLELAHRRLLWNDFGEASALWRKACSGGSPEACLFARPSLEEYREAFRRRCREKEAEACRAASEHEPNRVYYHALFLRRECEAGKGASCEALAAAAQRLARQEPILPLGAQREVLPFAR